MSTATATTATATTATASTLLSPRLIIPPGHQNMPDDVLECSVHTLPKPLLREFRHVFADQYLSNAPSVAAGAGNGTAGAATAVVEHANDDGDGCDGGGSTTTTSSIEGPTTTTTTTTTKTRELLAIPTNQRARQDLVAVGDHIEEEKDRLLNVVRYKYHRNYIKCSPTSLVSFSLSFLFFVAHATCLAFACCLSSLLLFLLIMTVGLNTQTHTTTTTICGSLLTLHVNYVKRYVQEDIGQISLIHVPVFP